MSRYYNFQKRQNIKSFDPTTSQRQTTIRFRTQQGLETPITPTGIDDEPKELEQ